MGERWCGCGTRAHGEGHGADDRGLGGGAKPELDMASTEVRRATGQGAQWGTTGPRWGYSIVCVFGALRHVKTQYMHIPQVAQAVSSLYRFTSLTTLHPPSTDFHCFAFLFDGHRVRHHI